MYINYVFFLLRSSFLYFPCLYSVSLHHNVIESEHWYYGLYFIIRICTNVVVVVVGCLFEGCGLCICKLHRVNFIVFLQYGVSLVLALLVRGEQVHAVLVDSSVWQEFLSALITALATSNSTSSSEGAIPKSTAIDTSKNEMAGALPSVALAASPCRPGQHLSRCSSMEPSLLKAAQEKMSQLEAAHSKPPRTQSPTKC